MGGTISFHEKTKAVKPNLESKPTTFWAGVLKLELKPDGPKSEEDYLWVKCHKKITVQTIREQYKKRNLVDDDFILKHDTKILDPDTMMQELDTFGDHIIALEAIKTSDIQARMQPSRRPLQPSNHQALRQTTSPASQDSSPGKALGRALTQWAVDNCSKSPSKPAPMSPNLILNRSESVQNENTAPSPISPYQSSYPDPSHEHIEAQQARKAPRSATVSDHSEEVNEIPKSATTASGTIATPSEYMPAQTSTNRMNTDVGEYSSVPEIGGLKPELDFKDQFATNDDSNAVTHSEPTETKNFQLQSFVANASLDVLEASVEKGVELLEHLKIPMLEKLQNSPDAAQWVQQIEHLQKQAVKTKTIVGVVGNTGAGKSSVINAMLDEERLVPTNCMRACTAVVTEISYNNTEHPYRAEIEFITATDWEKELKTLFQDLLDGNGEVSRDCTNEDTDAGIAYAKIRAVYPKKTKEDISNSSIQRMLFEVEHILGTSRTIEETDSLLFYKKLQRFVDSKEKSTGNKDKDKKKDRKEMEFWPLIRVVRINVKAPALSTGAVIVDLPGVHDSNAARAAVADGYMKQCTGLWIVAPINRAVDDKAAKSLLGESFKRQLKMDGGFSSVTFICSKTDDISLMEAQDSLGLDEEMSPSWEKIDALSKEQKSLERELEQLRTTKAEYGETMTEVDEQFEVWEALKDDVEAGKTVFLPTQSKKRKNTSSHGRNKKQRRSSTSEDDSSEDSDSEEDASEHSSEDELTRESDKGDPLNEDRISAKISELRTIKKGARSERLVLDQRIREIRDEIAEAKQAEEKIEAEMAALCISGRNEYSKGAIQQDFAAGIKELDQELAVEEDEENFNPDDEARDYAEVARSLPVFCVSSRGYQQLQGRLKKDAAVPGFKEIDETGIPQLQAHCTKLTVAGRTASCKRFITKLSQLLNSLSLWASSDGSGANMTREQMAHEARFLQGSLKKLESGLDKVVETTCRDLKEEFGDNIFDRYETAISNATQEASKTAARWGATVNREDRAAGGYFWSTYKAICRRNGVYSNAQGPHDWNVQLTDPVIKVIAAGWEKTFTRRTPSVMALFARNASNLIKQFHQDTDLRAQKVGASLAGLHMLQQQLHIFEDVFKDLSKTTQDSINASQKEINREFTPVIANAMEHAYTVCTEERGSGSYLRMKAAMNDHVGQERFTMFKDSTDEVRDRLKQMVVSVEETLNNKADEVFFAMSRDYRSVLGGSDIPEGEIMPKWDRKLRKDVMEIIGGAERTFKRAAGLEDEDTDSVNEQTVLTPRDSKRGVATTDRDSFASGKTGVPPILAEENDGEVGTRPSSRNAQMNEDFEPTATEGIALADDSTQSGLKLSKAQTPRPESGSKDNVAGSPQGVNKHKSNEDITMDDA